MSDVFLPGATIGVLGSGQLGRMLAGAARRMGYRVHTFSPDADTPTGQLADVEVAADYLDLDAVRAFARGVDVVTFEFENVPFATAEAAAEFAPVRPRGEVLHVAQHRGREKQFLAQNGFPLPPHAHATSATELEAALDVTGLPAVVKTADFGYDGKGQRRIHERSEVRAVWDDLGVDAVVVEGFVDFRAECSVVAARGVDGSRADYGVFENVHERHILDVTLSPARFDAALVARARELAHAILEALDVVGVMCVEFFVTRDDGLLVNELAPRPHNSGHLTVDACVTSQFEQQLRAVCGLPLGDTFQARPAAMVNLLGDLWSAGEPDWCAALAVPGAKLHLYGKAEARPGRKMGHVTALGDDIEAARRAAQDARARLTAGHPISASNPS